MDLGATSNGATRPDEDHRPRNVHERMRVPRSADACRELIARRRPLTPRGGTLSISAGCPVPILTGPPLRGVHRDLLQRAKARTKHRAQTHVAIQRPPKRSASAMTAPR